MSDDPRCEDCGREIQFEDDERICEICAGIFCCFCSEGNWLCDNCADGYANGDLTCSGYTLAQYLRAKERDNA